MRKTTRTTISTTTKTKGTRKKTKRKKTKRTGISVACLRKALQSAAIPVIAAALCCSGGLSSGQIQPSVVGPAGAPTTRSIVGTVLNEAGAPVPGARILLKNGKTLQIRSFIALQDGRYHFYGLSGDVDYELRAQANGMTSKTKNVSVFDSHSVIHLNLKLTKKFNAGD